jgi:tRNA-specific 2-thiouridylase
LSQTVTIAQLHWVNDPPKADRVAVKLRYRQADQFGELSGSDPSHERLTVNFETPQRAATPGQWACFYDGDICLGGGVIESSTGVMP